jgi:hypothetical protein
MRDVTRNTAFEDGDEDAIIVLRVVPRAWVTIAPGNYGRHGWISMSMGSQYWAEDGFVVAKVTPTDEMEDQAYAVTQVRPEHYTNMADEQPFTRETAMWTPVRYQGAMPGAVPALTAKAMASVGECPAFSPKSGRDMPVFRAPAGRVTYVGTIRIDASKNMESGEVSERIGITPITSPGDEALVAKLMAKRYPGVRARIVRRPLRMMRRNE